MSTEYMVFGRQKLEEGKIINVFSTVSKGRTVWLVAAEKGYLEAL